MHDVKHVRAVALDMDGVLVDLDARLSEIVGQNILEWRAARIEDDPYCVQKLIGDNLSCFDEAKPMPYLDQIEEHVLWLTKSGIRVFILSSVMCDEHARYIVGKKVDWLTKHTQGLLLIPKYFVVGGKNKALYARSDTVLVDDHKRNCQVFAESGGGYLHYTPGDGFFKFSNFVNHVIMSKLYA